MNVNERMSTDYTDKCGNCREYLPKSDKYCSYCGTKRGEGAFKPYDIWNFRCLYGSGIVLYQWFRCHNCSNVFRLGGYRNESQYYCTNCGSDKLKLLCQNYDSQFRFSLSDYGIEDKFNENIDMSKVTIDIDLNENPKISDYIELVKDSDLYQKSIKVFDYIDSKNRLDMPSILQEFKANYPNYFLRKSYNTSLFDFSNKNIEQSIKEITKNLRNRTYTITDFSKQILFDRVDLSEPTIIVYQGINGHNCEAVSIKSISDKYIWLNSNMFDYLNPLDNIFGTDTTCDFTYKLDKFCELSKRAKIVYINEDTTGGNYET